MLLVLKNKNEKWTTYEGQKNFFFLSIGGLGLNIDVPT